MPITERPTRFLRPLTDEVQRELVHRFSVALDREILNGHRSVTASEAMDAVIRESGLSSAGIAIASEADRCDVYFVRISRLLASELSDWGRACRLKFTSDPSRGGEGTFEVQDVQAEYDRLRAVEREARALVNDRRTPREPVAALRDALLDLETHHR